MREDNQRRAEKIKLVLMDCDGVLTSGHITLLPDGEEVKSFHSHDGQAIVLMRQFHIKTGIISGRGSKALEKRAHENRIDFLFQHSNNKLSDYQKILEQSGLTDEQVAYIGDDLPDIAVMRRVGFAVAVANAAPEVKATAHLVTEKSGGDGAVRESLEFILKAQSLWELVLNKYIF
ncbi:MAG: HAD hydrolase family protein [Blastocatellia bacterium]|nr:HAD hydrolase family protein [Blastocatellia bacterium]